MLDSAVETAPEAPRDLADGLFASGRRTPRWSPSRLQPAGPLGGGVLPGRGGPARWPTAALEVDLLVADERWLQRLLLRLAPYARVVSPHRLRRDVHGRRAATRFGSVRRPAA